MAFHGNRTVIDRDFESKMILINLEIHYNFQLEKSRIILNRINSFDSKKNRTSELSIYFFK